MAEEVSCTYCGQWRCWITGTKDHRTTNHIWIEVPLDNPQGFNPPAAPTEAPSPPAGVISQYIPTNNTARCVNLKESIATYLGGDLDIGGYSVYDDIPFILIGHLFIGVAVTSKSKSPTPDDLFFGTPDFCSDELFFRDELRKKLEANVFYDAVENIHKTGALKTDTKVTTTGGEPTPSDHPGNQYSDSSDSEDEPEPPDHASTGKCRQCGAYGWIVRDCTHCNGVYEPVYQADVSGYSVKKDPEYLGLDFP